jgi:uncharacterized membrane protein YraQ (UPF0718 family)
MASTSDEAGTGWGKITHYFLLGVFVGGTLQYVLVGKTSLSILSLGHHKNMAVCSTLSNYFNQSIDKNH